MGGDTQDARQRTGFRLGAACYISTLKSPKPLSSGVSVSQGPDHVNAFPLMEK